MRLWKLLVLVTAVMLFLMALVNWGYSMRIQHEELTMRVCSAAHVQNDRASEEECARLQDSLNVEFVCNQQNTGCWVEL